MFKTIEHMKIEHIHHIAIICSDYQKSKRFYTDILGFQVDNEVFRKDRQSYKLDLSLNGQYIIELFSFPNPPARPTHPEATGLRHLAFGVKDVEAARTYLAANGVDSEKIRIDEYTNRKFFFTTDPDQLPLEFYEI